MVKRVTLSNLEKLIELFYRGWVCVAKDQEKEFGDALRTLEVDGVVCVKNVDEDTDDQQTDEQHTDEPTHQNHTKLPAFSELLKVAPIHQTRMSQLNQYCQTYSPNPIQQIAQCQRYKRRQHDAIRC